MRGTERALGNVRRALRHASGRRMPSRLVAHRLDRFVSGDLVAVALEETRILRLDMLVEVDNALSGVA